MTRSPLSTALSLALVLFTAACGPMGPLPGGPLAGKVHEGAVTDWSFADGVHVAQLETNPADPYSVNVWCGTHHGKLYLPTSMTRGTEHPGEQQWTRNVILDPNVRVKLGDEIYLARANRVTDTAELEAAKAALVKKYASGGSELDRKREIWIFRLDPR